MIFCVVSPRPEVLSPLVIPFSPRRVFQIQRQARQFHCGNENGAIRRTLMTRGQRTKLINILTPRAELSYGFAFRDLFFAVFVYSSTGCGFCIELTS